MNTYKQNDIGEMCVVDASGKLWECDTPHPMPTPTFVSEEGLELLFAGTPRTSNWTVLNGPRDTHWLARRPLPPVPKPKSQEELDEEALEVAAYQEVGPIFNENTARLARWHFTSGWKQAIAYARKEKP